MRTGRPPSADRKRLPELDGIAAWFVEAIEKVGHGSIRRTAEMTGLNQRALYDAVNAERMLPLRMVRAIAEGLGHDPEEIARLWAKAKQELDRAEDVERRQTRSRPTTWADIPWPSPALRDLLGAQDGILDCLPYSLLGLVEPPLSAVYVRQSIRHRPTEQPIDQAQAPLTPGSPREETGTAHHASPQGGRSESAPLAARDGVARASATDPVISLPDALARHDHLLITGEAGAGKSTLASHLVRSLCGVWLRRSSFQDAPVGEPLVPLRLPASLLAAEGGSWSERLRRASVSTMGGGLVSDPPVSLFSGRSQGARWIIFVDGLDEVADRRQRAELIRTLARHCQRDSDFRLVVTSRPLPPIELAPLHDAMLGEFEIQPLGQLELADYVRKWFEQQRARVPNPAAAADRFLSEVATEGDLRELVRNPLMATIALVNATLEPSLPPPSNRLTLYESFLERLRDRSTYGEAAAFPVWLADSVNGLVRVLARLRSEGGEDLVAAARDYIRERPPTGVVLPAGWEGELPAALGRTGLLVVAGDQLRFLHQSFAEFLAAQEYAEELPTDGAGLEAWIRRACRGAQQLQGLFVLCRWATRTHCSGLIMDQIFAHPGPERTLLAAALLTEGVDIGSERVAKVIHHLVALVRGDDDEECEKAANVLAALGAGHGTAPLLENLAQAPGLTSTQRFLAVSGVSRLVPPAVTAALLTPLLELLYDLLPKAAQLAQQLDESVKQAVRERLTDLLAEPDTNAWEEVIAVETYRVLGAAEEAERLARRVLNDPLAGPDLIRRGAAVWLGSAPSAAAIADVAALGRARPSADHGGRLAVARALERAGAVDEAAELARAIVEASDLARHENQDAAELWLRVRGATAAEPVRQLLTRGRELGWELWRQAQLLQIMVDAGVESPAGDWAEAVLSGDHQLPIRSADIIRLWLAGRGPTGAAELRSLIGAGVRLHLYDRAEYAQILLDGGLPDDGFQAALLTLRSPGLRALDSRKATEVLFKVDRKRAIEVLTAQFSDFPGESAWGAGVLAALTDAMPDLDDLRLRIAGHVLEHPVTDSAHVVLALGTLAELGERDRLPYIAERICRHPALDFGQQRFMARALVSCGEEEFAQVIWRHLLSVRGYSSESTGIQLLEDVVQALTPEIAAELVREQLESDPAPTPFQRRRLEALLAWLADSVGRG
jgi:hypothetical protein